MGVRHEIQRQWGDVSDVYPFYLDGDDATDVMAKLVSRTPFLGTDTDKVEVTGYGSTVNVRMTGRVYSSSNSDLFYDGGIAVMPVALP
ncbi:hypothetical protein [Pluralibacter sp.]|jgi:hypothetical protein|uniref:hypothetical protein n=1 Tax=Pluralibacter sp. TaxID=1920032 RepID=UPI0025CCEA47|nr:hypothetical protein [Pluralibacter sp.]